MAWFNDLTSLGQPSSDYADLLAPKTKVAQALSDPYPLLAGLGGLYGSAPPETPLIQLSSTLPGQNLKSYEPSLRDKIAGALLGDYPSQPKRDFVQGLFGSMGAGNSRMSLADLTPLGSLFGAQEAARQGDYQGAALAAVPIPGSRRSIP